MEREIEIVDDAQTGDVELVQHGRSLRVGTDAVVGVRRVFVLVTG